MERATELDVIRQIRTLAAERRSDADARITHVDVERYRSAESLARERQMFRSRWLAVLHASAVAAPGDYVALTVVGVNVLIVRDRESRIRAFLNVCRHRGSKLAEGRGCEKSFTCPYHGWTYGLDGALLAIPHEWGFEGFDKSCSGLAEVAVHVECEIIHVRLAGDAPFDGGALEEVARFVPPDSVAFCPRVKTVAANWKVIIDGALEAYHIKRTHTDTIYPMFIDNVAMAERIGDDVRVVMPKRTIRELEEGATDDWALREHANIVYFCFPNVLVLVLGDHAMLLWLDPVDVARTTIHSVMLVPPGDQLGGYWRANEELFQRTLDEDYEIGESIQSGLASGANDQITLGRYEKGIRLFHEILDEALSAEQA